MRVNYFHSAPLLMILRGVMGSEYCVGNIKGWRQKVVNAEKKVTDDSYRSYCIRSNKVIDLAEGDRDNVLEIMKSNVRLYCGGSNCTITNGEDQIIIGGSLTNDSIQNITIEGIQFSGASKTNIAILGADVTGNSIGAEVSVKDCKFHDNMGEAVIKFDENQKSALMISDTEFIGNTISPDSTGDWGIITSKVGSTISMIGTVINDNSVQSPSNKGGTRRALVYAVSETDGFENEIYIGNSTFSKNSGMTFSHVIIDGVNTGHTFTFESDNVCDTNNGSCPCRGIAVLEGGNLSCLREFGPTESPSFNPSHLPSYNPSRYPSMEPSISSRPTSSPTNAPSHNPNFSLTPTPTCSPLSTTTIPSAPTPTSNKVKKCKQKKSKNSKSPKEKTIKNSKAPKEKTTRNSKAPKEKTTRNSKAPKQEKNSKSPKQKKSKEKNNSNRVKKSKESNKSKRSHLFEDDPMDSIIIFDEEKHFIDTDNESYRSSSLGDGDPTSSLHLSSDNGDIDMDTESKDPPLLHVPNEEISNSDANVNMDAIVQSTVFADKSYSGTYVDISTSSTTKRETFYFFHSVLGFVSGSLLLLFGDQL